MQATRWLRERVADAFSLIFLLERGVRIGGLDPHAVRQAIEGAVVRVKYDDRARTLGFTPEHMNRVRLALIASADEITQRPGSRINYAAPPPPGQPPLLQQKHFNGTTIAGHTFFAELAQTIDSRVASEPEAAVLEAYAVCLAFGFRGKYEAHDIEGYEAMRARLNDKLRRSLAVPVELPVAVPAPWPQQRSLHAPLLWIGGLSVLFAVAMLLTYHLVLAADASALRQRLGELLTATS